jgi:hypothetical protein
LSGYGPERPRPDSILYSLNADDNSALWITYDDRADAWTRQFLPGDVSKAQPVQKYLAGFSRPLISAVAPSLPLSPPIAELVEQNDRGNGLHAVKLKIRSQRGSGALYFRFAEPVRPDSMKLAGKDVQVPKHNVSGLNLYATGEQGVELEFALKGGSISFWLMDRSDGLPGLVSQRPPGFIAQNGSDVTFVCRKYTFPVATAQK